MFSLGQFLVILIAIAASTPGRCQVYDQNPPASPSPSSYRRLVFYMRDILASETSASTLPEDSSPPASPEPDLISYFAHLQGLEVSAITPINEDMKEYFTGESLFLGKVRGVYVAVTPDSSERIVALTARFADAGDDHENSLRFFGIRQSDSTPSQIIVIGGTGRYNGANGYATLERIPGIEKNLSINVTLKL